MSKVITGRGKIEFSKEKDKDKMEKKYPDVQFEKMNPLIFTTTYKGNELFDLKIKVGDTEIPCSFKRWAEPWKYGSKLALTPHFKDLGKKAIFSVSGGIQGKLFQFFRYDYEKMLGKKKGGGKKRTVKKRKRNANSAYFEFRSGSSRKFWRIVKNGSKITTHYGKFGTLGQMTTKDYGSKVDQAFDSLLKSKKKKGYVEKTDYGDSNPKPPTKVEREYMKTCNKAEQNKVLNPNMINYDCEGMMDQGDSELKWMTGWHKDALKNKDYDWSSYNEHSKSKRKKK
jgi:predicted DNA-binding WGR domain protein